MTENTLYSRGNPYSVVAPTGTYTATHGEFVISDGSDITLPAAEPDSVVVVRASPGTETTVLPPGTTTLQLQEKGVALGAGECGVFISDGLDWYVENTVDFTGRDIPDIATYRYKHDEGSGTVLGDSDPDDDGNTVDGTISNPTWVSDNSAQGGYKLSFDDSSSAEYVDFATLSQVGTSSNFAVGVTVELDTLSDTGVIWDHATAQDDTVVFGLSDNTLSGEITALQYDGSFKNERTLGGDTTTNRMRLLVNFSLADSDNQSINIYKNASDVDASASSAANEFVATSGDSGHTLGSRIDDRASERLGGDTDDLIIYNDTLTSSQRQADYNLQPWS